MAAQAKLLHLCLAAFCLPAFANVPRGLLLTEKLYQGGESFVLPSHRGSTAFTEGAASETNNYDSFGNRWVTTVRGLVSDPFTPAGPGWFSAASNQMTGVPYDAAGNQIQFNPYTLRYDAEGRVVSATSAANGSAVYAYDGEGRRVKKIVNGNATTVYVYDGLGRLAAEYGAGSGGSGLEFLTEDHLGSVRLVTGALGNVIRRHDYRPFGQDLSGVNGRGPKYGNFENVKRFTGKERDAETWLDYFGARYLSGAQGRFTSPDAPFADQKPEDPQSWNLYSYVRNNPLRYTDPTGRCLYPGADCFQYLVGGAKAVTNLPSDAGTLLNRGINALTGANIPDAPRFEGANYDQRAGMVAAGFAMLVTPLAEAGAARISSTVSGAARVEASAAAVEGATPKLLAAPKARGNLNTAEGPAKVMVDSKGNAIPLKPGVTLTGSPDGRFLQVRDAQGRPTGMRLDGPHKPSTHPDPRAQRPHAHVTGRTNPDGTPWLPVNQ